jgi:uncharacterized protein (DUF488 family)
VTLSALTIGHSTHSIDRFIQLLEEQRVTAVADVRSEPYSRRRPEFNRQPLAAALGENAISYVFLGLELGARPRDQSLYVDGRVRFELLGETDAFREGLSRVRDGLSRHTVALLCAESDPIQCHRGLLIAPRLEDQGVDVTHILRDGLLESHEEAMTRLLALHGMPPADVFGERAELIEIAATRQENRIAFVRPETSDPGR